MNRSLASALVPLAFLAPLTLSSLASSPAAAATTPFIRVLKITPTYTVARISCPHDPDPRTGQEFMGVYASTAPHVTAVFPLDVEPYCDSSPHRVTLPYDSTYSTTSLAPGDRVSLLAQISGDSGEINFTATRRVQR